MKKILLSLLLLSSFAAYSQTKTDTLLLNKSYRFITDRVNSSLANRYPELANVNGKGYYLEVLPDSVSAYLPFFGRAYSPTFDSKGIDFGNKKFTYEQKKGRKGKTIIKITVNNLRDADTYSIVMTVFPNGNANLNLYSNRRESISYDGKIEPIPTKE